MTSSDKKSLEGLPYWPATEIIQKIKCKEVSVETVVTLFLERIEKYNFFIKAVVFIANKAEIIAEARDKDRLLNKGIDIGELHGLPITVKDSFNVKGMTTSNGQSKYKDYVAQEDAELIRRLKNAGAIILGKTNLPLFSIDWQTTNTWYGRTNNPYDLNRVAGGSSGGSAAAIAMAFSALELGSDAGGSIRVPAHFCGICGLRPTEGALSNRGQFKLPNKTQGHRFLTVPGPLAKNVGDLLLVMPILWDNNALQAELSPLKFNSSNWDGKKLNIAYSNSINNIEVDNEYQTIFTGFIHKLNNLNHKVQRDCPQYDEATAYQLHGRLLGFEIDAGSPVWTWLTTWFFYLFILFKYRDRFWARGVATGIGMSATKYLETLQRKDALTDVYTGFFEKHDIWITPVASITAFKHQTSGKAFAINSNKVPYTTAMAGFNFSTALSGHPIIVIPIGQTSDGMPVGVQIHAKKWTDKKLLEIAQYLERLTIGFIKPRSSDI